MSSSALIGALVGSATALIATLVVEGLRWRREHLIRWDDRRRICYAEYAFAVKTETTLCLRMAAALYPDVNIHTHPLSIADGLVKLADASDRRAALFEEVRLLGAPDVELAARNWKDAVWSICVPLWKPELRDAQTFLAGFKAAGRTRDEFFRLARQDLGVRKELKGFPDWSPEDELLPF